MQDNSRGWTPTIQISQPINSVQKYWLRYECTNPCHCRNDALSNPVLGWGKKALEFWPRAFWPQPSTSFRNLEFRAGMGSCYTTRWMIWDVWMSIKILSNFCCQHMTIYSEPQYWTQGMWECVQRGYRCINDPILKDTDTTYWIRLGTGISLSDLSFSTMEMRLNMHITRGNSMFYTVKPQNPDVSC